MPRAICLRREGNEFGAVTGRPRRCGWFDAPLLRYTAMVNGFDTLMITKLDVLDHLDEIPVCIGYRLAGADVTEMPATYRALEAIEPVYEKLPGWRTTTRGIARFDDLPDRARACLPRDVTWNGKTVRTSVWKISGYGTANGAQTRYRW